MKEIVPGPSAAPTPIVDNRPQAIRGLFDRYVVPSYGRFDVVLSHGSGSHVWDVSGKRYLDFGGGIAVCALGHAHPEIAEALSQQARRLIHVSNLYYHEAQGRLAQEIVRQLAAGKVFFCNSGAEANEGLFKVARKFGHEHPGPDGPRYEIITTRDSFHGRTLAGIAATGQDKFKKGFEPMVDGFRCDVPFNDLDAMCAAVGPKTVALLIEGIQGEGGIRLADSDYLLGLRRLCDERNLLLMIDAVQCGHFRSGRFQSFQRILESLSGTAAKGFLPDAIAMAKSLAGGFPMGAFWIRQPNADVLGPGTHASTFGGSPLGCAVALKVLEIIERDRLADNVRTLGDWMKSELTRIASAYPDRLTGIRGLGFMIGIELAARDAIPAFARHDRPSSLQMTNLLHAAGVLTVPSGERVVRLLPPLNLSRDQAEQGIEVIERVARSLA
jgi:acetylornithine aminotransferase/acetylornithine/N-succinyldiaminopimelate aminotransferase